MRFFSRIFASLPKEIHVKTLPNLKTCRIRDKVYCKGCISLSHQFHSDHSLEYESLESGYCTRMEDYALWHLNLKCQGAFMLWSNKRMLLGRCFIFIFLMARYCGWLFSSAQVQKHAKAGKYSGNGYHFLLSFHSWLQASTYISILI